MAFQGDSIFWVEVEKIVANPFQPRREFDEDRLRELGDSIRMYGVLQPLTVSRKEVHRDDGTFFTEYELIAGERRLRASRLAGVEQVPVIIRSGEQTEQEKLELAIIENLQREDLNAVDRSMAFKQLADAFDLSFTQVAKKVGRSREYVSNSIRLLALPENVLESLKVGDLSEGHARTLLMLNDKPEELEVLYREILLKKLSVREVERIARKIATDKVRKKRKNDPDANLIAMEREFTDTLGTRVQIMKTDFGGKLTIDYFTEDELEKLLHVIKSQRTLLESQVPDGEDSGPVVQSLADAESALEALSATTPLRTQTTADNTETETETESSDTATDTDAGRTHAAVPVTPHQNADVTDSVTSDFANTHVDSTPEESTDTATDQDSHETDRATDSAAAPADTTPASTEETVQSTPYSSPTASDTPATPETSNDVAQEVSEPDTAARTSEVPPEPSVVETPAPDIADSNTQKTEDTTPTPAVSEDMPQRTITLRFHYFPAFTLLQSPAPTTEAVTTPATETTDTPTTTESPATTTDQSSTSPEEKPEKASHPDDDLYSVTNFSI